MRLVVGKDGATKMLVKGTGEGGGGAVCPTTRKLGGVGVDGAVNLA